VLLILASYFFYGWWDWRFCGLLLFLTLLNYFSALAVHSESPHRRTYLCLNITGNLAVLGFFKYYNFFAESLATALSHLGIHPYLPVLHIILPIGVSFYTFQMMGYTLDVYKGRFPAARDFISVAAFMSFFPLLLAGPIERAGRMLPQFQKPRSVDSRMVSSGLLLMLIGFFKKIAIADSVSPEVDSVFSQAATAPWPELIGGLWLYTIQIYCDFSGYTDIARGVGRLLGFEIMLNFNHPYFAANIGEFWRRWHISLSTWLRDYLYIPLGGSREGVFKTYRNLMLTMVLCGLWHGANWTYVVWGTLHGIYLCGYRLLFGGAGDTSRALPAARTIKLCSIIFTFNLVALAWLFFRAPSMSEALIYLQGIILLRGSWENYLFYFWRIAFYIGLVLLIDIPQYLRNDHTTMLEWPWVLRGVVYGSMIILMILLAPANEMPFIYFQF
jgi:D-alanyl-lipoteichoic acid acyltransferase DltB (MBOAT superfamily)